ncbi:MAG TPA: hypothetical protein VFR58_13045 [Flavisolibacter sp.]|nr:hypothetical protein [Flavisolibacter sp.]
MNLFKHVTNTWLLSLLLQPPVFFLYFYRLYQEGSALVFPQMLAFSFAFSWPAYLLNLLCFGLIRLMPITGHSKFLTWLLLSSMNLGLTVFSDCFFLFNTRFFNDFILLSIPSFIAGWLAILLRYRQFQHFALHEEGAAA